MTYTSKEISTALGRPKVLIKFYDDFGEEWRYNSGPTSVTHLAQVYTADICKVSELEITSNPFRNIMKIELSRGNAYAAQYLVAPLESKVMVVIYRLHDADYIYYWSGMVAGVVFDDDVIPTVNCIPRTSSASKVGKRRCAQKLCDLVLYGQEIGGCSVDKESFKIEGVIDSIDGTTLESSSFMDQDTDWLKGGEIVIGNARRLIKSHTGRTTINDFTLDDDIKALWRFENGALTTDSKGENALTNTGVNSNIESYKEGFGSAQFGADSRLYINDSDLDTGFPLKNGDANKKLTLCTWLYVDTMPTWDSIIFMKYASNKCSIKILINPTGYLTLYISAGGVTYETSYYHATPLVIGRWYHVGITYQASDGAYRIRIYDATAAAIHGSDKTGTLGSVYVGTAPIFIGYLYSPTRDHSFYGKLDEMIVFNRVLTTDEIDEIRTNTFDVVPQSGGDTGSIIISRSIISPEENSAGEIEFVAYAGCSHAVGMCLNKFNNIINFGGQRYLPTKNPYTGDPITY